MRASPPFIATPRFRPTAVVLIITFILLTNTACINLPPSPTTTASSATSNFFIYEVQLLYQDEETELPAQHGNLQGVPLAIFLEDNERPLQEDRTDYDGHAYLTLERTLLGTEAKLVIGNNNPPLEKDIIIGHGAQYFTILYYEDGSPPRFSNEQLLQIRTDTEEPRPVATRRYLLADSNNPAGIDSASDSPNLHNAGSGGGSSKLSSDETFAIAPTPTASPRWQLVWEETFNNPPVDNWPSEGTVHQNGTILVEIRNGSLRHLANFGSEEHTIRLKHPTPCLPTAHDLLLEVDVMFISSGQGTKTTAVIMLHHTGSEETNDENYYAIGFTNQGEYVIQQKQNNVLYDLVSLTSYVDNITTLPSYGFNHRVTIEVINNRLHLSLNNIHLTTVTLAQPLRQTGSVWLGIEGEANGVGILEFDNIRLSQLQN